MENFATGFAFALHLEVVGLSNSAISSALCQKGVKTFEFEPRPISLICTNLCHAAVRGLNSYSKPPAHYLITSANFAQPGFSKSKLQNT